MFPEFPTSRAVVGLGIFVHIFEVGKVPLIKAKVR